VKAAKHSTAAVKAAKHSTGAVKAAWPFDAAVKAAAHALKASERNMLKKTLREKLRSKKKSLRQMKFKKSYIMSQ